MKNLRNPLFCLHQVLGLALAVVWMLQGLTGALLAFRWELEDQAIAGIESPLDIQAINRRVDELRVRYPGWRPADLWTAGATANRFDLTMVHSELPGERKFRLNGIGTILREKALDDVVKNGGLYELLIELHVAALAPPTGYILIGFSGLLVLTSIVAGIALAWDRSQSIRALMLPQGGWSMRRGLASWHRALGMWFAMPAIIIIACGAAIAFEDQLRDVVGIPYGCAESVWPRTGSPPVVAMTTAVAIAYAPFPDSTLTSVKFPTANSPWYRVKLLQPGEPRRAYGRTCVFVDAGNAKILGIYDAIDATIGERALDLLYPLHTGEVFGVPSRVIAAVTGVWLAMMAVLGFVLWRRRRWGRA